MEKILISHCLLGESVRYDGQHALVDHPLLQQWQQQGRLIPLCPEVAGGLSVPRPPAEVQGANGQAVLSQQRKVITIHQQDVTDAFIKGADTAANLCNQHQIHIALLKSKSPSCGNQSTYDGTFTGTLLPGEGVTSARLTALGVRVFNELELTALNDYLQRLESTE